MTRVSRHWGYKLISYFTGVTVEKVQSPVSGTLDVRLANGRLLLDTAHANYSFGSLHRLFQKVFRAIRLKSFPPSSVLMLGLGAGSVVSILRDEYGLNMPVTAVDADPEVIRLAREHFGIGRYRGLEIVCEDAVTWIRAHAGTFGMIVIDLFVDNDVPEPVTTRTFLSDCKARLSPGGLMILNFIVHSGSQREKYERLLLNANAAGLEYTEKRIFASNRVLFLRHAGSGKS